jgi:hypothetical protein
MSSVKPGPYTATLCSIPSFSRNPKHTKPMGVNTMHRATTAARPNRMATTLAQSLQSVNPSMTRDTAMTPKHPDDSTSDLENLTAVLCLARYIVTSRTRNRLHGHLLSQETALPKLGKSGHGR